VSSSTDTDNQVLEEVRAYLETLTWIQIDPRLRSKFGLSDVVQATLIEAWQDLKRIQALDAEGRRHWLRRMLVNNMLEEIKRFLARKRDYRLEQSLETAAEESSCRLQSWLAAEDTSPSDHLAGEEDKERLLKALSQLPKRSSCSSITPGSSPRSPSIWNARRTPWPGCKRADGRGCENCWEIWSELCPTTS
jgi:DNA-directed RNA polymerase specialized sigma24 family protein